MKVRWKEHEVVLVTLIAGIIIASYIWDMFWLTPAQMATYAAPFIKAGIPFSYYERVLLPQIGTTLLLWLSYLWVNRLVLPQLFNTGKNYAGRFIWAVLQFIIIAYIIGPVTNYISFYVNPYYHPANSFLPLTFGYHPQPLLNALGGINDAYAFLFLCIVYAVFRTLITNYIERESERKSYRILIVNQTTTFLVVFLCIPVFTSVFNLVTDHIYYAGYFALILPVQAVFVTNTYWLFPLKGDRSFFKWQFLGPLLFLSFCYCLLFSIALGSSWSLIMVLFSWAIQLIFVTPISWLDYQQRKDKILQLRGAEKALVKSNADLYALRSQINPHFLFNAFNTLYGTALIEGSVKTAEGIQKLGDMMRFMLHDNTLDYIAMEREIEYLKNYIDLQKLRTQTSEDIIIEDNIGEQVYNHKLAPMLLIPFVENAFKHGISLTGKSWIKIKLECNDQYISFEVRNSLHTQVDKDPEKNQSGVGLNNVQQRLRILYRGKHQLSYGIQSDEYVVKLQIEPIIGILRKEAIKLNWM